MTAASNRKRRRYRRLNLTRNWRFFRSYQMINKRTVTIEEIARLAGFTPSTDGKFNFPAKSKGQIKTTMDRILAIVLEVFGTWHPGNPAIDLTMTWSAPIWMWLGIAHALHGRVQRLTYSSLNGEYVVWSHGL